MRFSSTPTLTRMVCAASPPSLGEGSVGGWVASGKGGVARAAGAAACVEGSTATGGGGTDSSTSAGTAASLTGAVQIATVGSTGLPRKIASSVATVWASSPGGSAPVVARTPTISFMMSAARSTAVMRSGVAVIEPSRNRPSTFSAEWATRSSLGRPRKPQVPLMVWTRRKIRPTVAPSWGVRSSVSNASSSAARLSLASVKNSDSRSSMGVL